MPKLIGISSAFPPYVLTQEAAKAFARKVFPDLLGPPDGKRLLAVFDHSEVDTRYLCVPLTWLEERRTFFQANEKYIEAATELGTAAVEKLLKSTHVSADRIDHFVFVSTTGLATPSIDAHIANRIPFRPDLRRTPVWGLGCLGGAGGLALAAELARSDPKSHVLLLTLELCSLTFQPDDRTKKNLIAASLFGDGAGACLVVGDSVKSTESSIPSMEVVASEQRFWPDSLSLMGWDIRDPGLYVILSPRLPAFVLEEIGPGMARFLQQHGLHPRDLSQIAAHPGGVRILDALAKSLNISDAPLRHSRAVLREYGNISSPTCLVALERILKKDPPAPGEPTVVAAMGPGFSSEYVLLRRLLK